MSDNNTSLVSRQAGAGQGITLVTASFLPVMAIVALSPVVPLMIQQFRSQPGADLMVPLMVSAPGLLIVLVSPLAGWLADKFGRRRLLVVATFFYAALGAAPAFLNDLPTIIGCRLALGVTEAIILTMASTLFGDYYQGDRRRFWLTVQGVTGSLFGTGVIALNGLLAAQGWHQAFLIYLVAFPIFLGMVFFVFETKRPAAEWAQLTPVDPVPVPWKSIARVCGVTLFTSILYYVFIIQAGRAIAAIGITSAKDIGFVISAASVGVPVGALIYGKLSKTVSHGMMACAVIGLLGAGMLGIGNAHGLWMTLAFAWVQQMGAGMSIPVLLGWAHAVTPLEHRGRGIGLWVTAFFMGQFVSPLFVKLAQSASGDITGAFAVMGVVGLIGAASGLVMHRMHQGKIAV